MNIKEYLFSKFNSYYGETIANEIMDVYSKDKVTSFRVNTLKSNFDEIVSVLNSNHINYETVPYIDNAIVINGDESLLRDLDIYKDGKIYLQSLSSMLPPLFMDLEPRCTVLDMAAAPGGKTSEICALMANNVFVTAVEPNSGRMSRLQYNIEHLGCKNVSFLKTDSRSLDEYFVFDHILLDTPCSGSGTIINDDYSGISEELIEKINKTQYELLRKAVSLLKKGSTMIYSTCSILKEENEEVINKVMKEFNLEVVSLELDVELLPSTIDGALTVMPSEYNEGFFVCKLKKL